MQRLTSKQKWIFQYRSLWIFLLVMAVSSCVFILEGWVDGMYGNNDGIIFKGKFHSKLVLFHFFVNAITLIYLFSKATKEWLKNLALSLAATFFILMIIELLFFTLLCSRAPILEGKVIKAFYKPEAPSAKVHYTKLTPYLGYTPIARNSYYATSTLITNKDSTLVYSVGYSFDEHARRESPYEELSKKKDKFVLFFGGSFTLGEGLEADETMPYYFMQLDNQVQAYNYGFSGYGASQMLSRLRFSELKSTIKQNSGIAIYTFNNDHPKRDWGFKNFQVTYGALTPSYLWQGDQMHYRGTFKSANPVLTYFYFLLDNSNFMEYFHLDIPLKVRDKHLQFSARLIEESYKEFQKNFGELPFYVIIFPGNSDEIASYISEPGIKVLNYSKAFSNLQDYLIYPPYENHPKAIAYQKVMEWVYRDIQ